MKILIAILQDQRKATLSVFFLSKDILCLWE